MNPIEITEKVLACYSNRKKDVDVIFDMWDEVYNKLGDHYDEIDLYISCYPSSFDKQLCFCSNKRTINERHFHITNEPCSIAESGYCINVDSLEISEHKIGECPHAEYIYVEKE